MLRSHLAWSAAACAVVGVSVAAAAAKPAPKSRPATARVLAPDFNREVRPILSRHCFKCHGPDEATRQGKLRLDLRASALAPAATGRRAVVPGKPEQSELLRRVHMTGGGVMPPPATKNPLNEQEKDVLRRWIASGAEYRQHWSFVPPKAAPLPAVKLKGWARNPIDHFILARLEKAGLRPAPEADRYTLARRLYLDLIGLPPTPEEADAFVTDQSPNAYEKLVDRLLASPQYGERWARKWLDLARYADTNGYEKDRPRSVWPYRDWVINALNRDMPFNQFTIEQIAGDMLPNATPEQRVATGFHRNTMLNEEGGIDPLEFRFHAMTDRIATTGTTWLGLTVGCTQCHTHKYDPITHREYYQLFAFLNNAEEPEFAVPKPDIAARRAEAEKQAAALEATLEERFPPEGEIRWQPARPSAFSAESGARGEIRPDSSVLVSGGGNPATDTYTLSFSSPAEPVTSVRIEALTDPSLGGKGPGRTPHGNFVLSEVSLSAAGPDGAVQPVKFTGARADFFQEGFAAGGAADGNPKTGWAIHGPGNWNVDRSLVLDLEKPVTAGAWTLKLEQAHGQQHTLGRFRVSFGRRLEDGRPLEARRREHLEKRLAAWEREETERAVRWTVLKPSALKTNLPLLTVLSDNSILASGDQTKRDVYDLTFKPGLRGVTAIRLEALPHESLPKDGPGRTYYEGPFGDFHLSELLVAADGQPVPVSGASQTFGTPAANALDRNPQTGWNINGGQGRAHAAVFRLAEPAQGEELSLSLIFERYYAPALGRFRISVTTDPRGAEARHPAEIEEILATAADSRTAEQKERLKSYYLTVAPELGTERERIRQLRASMPEFPTTLVFRERAANNPRSTFVHRRGEFLQPLEQVQPAVLSVLHPLPADAPKNRLTFARWLVDTRNPLVGRVTVNRQWAAFFGRGIVRTTEDFGLQGESPTHPELLDYLAVAFTTPAGSVEARKHGGKEVASSTPKLPDSQTSTPGLGWSIKRLHRLIVTSATYRQSSRVTPELLAKDPLNKLLARGPRFRVEAEMVRDSVLKTSGLLSGKMFGPSVFPPQPPGVTSEGTYGALQWKVSEGEDRYRRGLYTFTKRTAPFAQFITFDAPSGEACVARRDVSNTPLQALTLLNDAAFVEGAQALGKLIAGRSGTPEERAGYLFRRVLTRPPAAEELSALVRFYAAQKERLAKRELDAAAITGGGEGDLTEAGAWALVARALLNLDEAIVKR